VKVSKSKPRRQNKGGKDVAISAMNGWEYGVQTRRFGLFEDVRVALKLY
jgi:hypothetical protein